MPRQFMTFILVGILNTMFGYAVYAFFIFLHLHYSLAVLLATIIGVLFNFKTIGHFVFKNASNALLYRFVGVYAITYLLNVAGLKGCDLYHINMYLAGFIVAGPVAVVAFVLQRTFVFRRDGVISHGGTGK